ncbi:ISAs1-like element ISRba7 family transposase [Rhodopirellula baltica]|nr:ISAs1-like element ISRba7 family transposase [Rhodopirellula baltica]CAD71760.1 putative transposase [Rhodopirellula baltica SH 1]CAD73593.1 H repeat-associated protein ydcC [Rhodopirellula baltica SH 1]
METAMLSQIDVFHDCFDQVEDPRVPGRTTHPLNSILFLVVAATIADADGPEEIECFGNERLDWLSRFADFPHGIPSHDTIGRVLSLIKPEQFQQALLDWHTQLCQQYRDAEDKLDRDEEQSLPIHVAIDGKTARGSYTNAEKSNAIHFVSAWASKHGVTLGQTEVDSKTNEITAIDELLDFIDVRGTIITLDAIGAQKSIAEKIHRNGGDYIFAIKDNHPKLANAIREHFELVHEEGLKANGVKSKKTVGKKSGRQEERFYAVCPIPPEMKAMTDLWAGATSIGQAITQTERNGECHVEVRYFLLSRPARVGEFAISVRSHWSVESMHWVLDVVFHDDASRIRTKNATANFTFIRRYVTTLLKQDTTKRSLKQKRKKAGWNTDFLEKLMFSA